MSLHWYQPHASAPTSPHPRYHSRPGAPPLPYGTGAVAPYRCPDVAHGPQPHTDPAIRMMMRRGSRAMVKRKRLNAGPKAMKVHPKKTASVMAAGRVVRGWGRGCGGTGRGRTGPSSGGGGGGGSGCSRPAPFRGRPDVTRRCAPPPRPEEARWAGPVQRGGGGAPGGRGQNAGRGLPGVASRLGAGPERRRGLGRGGASLREGSALWAGPPREGGRRHGAVGSWCRSAASVGLLSAQGCGWARAKSHCYSGWAESGESSPVMWGSARASSEFLWPRRPTASWAA